jgi:hypothetical protein
MPDPKKPSTVDQIVDLLKGLISEPASDQSSRPPTRAGVRKAKAAMNPRRRKPAAKSRPKAKAAKKKRVTATRKKKPATRKKKTARK